jgi:uncharacterized protein YkwD
MTTSHRLMSRLLLIFILAAWCAETSAADGKKPVLTDAQRKEMQGVIAQFRKVRGQQEQRLAAIENMQNVGPIGLGQLLDIIQKELGKPVGDYRQAFFKAAAGEGVKNLNESYLAEITKLRGEVLALSKQQELKKEDIIKVGDPGLARLKELIIFNRDDVLKKHPELSKRRDALQPLGKQWEKCSELLLTAQAEEEEKAKKEKEKKDSEKAEAKAKTKADQDATETEEPMEFPSFEKYLVKEEEIAAALAMPMDEQTRLTLAANAQLAGKLDPEEARCILDLNLTRSLLGLKALQIDPPLTAAARDHSGDMETLKFFAHESPVPGKKTPGDRTQRFGTSYSGENIAMGTVDGTAANLMWWHSPGHHKNMLGSHSRVGVGKSGTYWTELFGN